MELMSSMKDTWKLCALGSLFAWLILLLSTKQNNQNVSLLAATKAAFQFAPIENPPTLTIINETVNSSNSTSTSTNKAKSTPMKSLRIGKKNSNKNNTKKKCDMFDGRWVFRPEQKSGYDSISCPFIEEKFSCQNNGRPDFDYEKWVWEATDCDIPLFDGKDMLERLRNKRVIIVGDSLNRNMWESLSCLLYSSIPSSRAEVHAENPEYKVFKAKDYNFMLEFFWSPFLVDFNKNHGSGKKVLVVDKLSPNYKKWRGADVMVFNSGHWWTHTGKFKVWDLFEYKGQLMEEMPIELAYERGMKTWTRWIKKNVDSNKTKVVFRSISALHNNKPWCYNSTQPLLVNSYEKVFPTPLINVIDRLIYEMTKLQIVTYLNITKLTQYRIDAHPSAYKNKNWKIYTQNKISLIPYVDCSHWCLPGLPDTWNRLLYASLFYKF